MKIAVFGTGAAGGYFGGRLAAAGEDVAFLARGRQLEALRRSGLSIASPKGDVRLDRVAASGDPAEIGPVDVVLFGVKLYDAAGAAAALGPLLGPNTAVVTMQNGVEVVEIVSRHVGAEHVVAGAAYIMASMTEPGRIRHVGADTLLFGERDGSRSARLAALEAAGNRAGFKATLSPTIELDLWVKFVRLATWAGMTAVTRSPMGVLRSDPALDGMMHAALEEAIAVGRARGIPLPADLRAETDALVARFPDEAKSSMLEDLEHGRRLELPWLSGAIVRMGREAGVPTPVHSFIAAALGPFVDGRR
ncbi:MAG TPA: 2-dehydropantoate 2-reductase [Candidatus Sulfotelmatobacter sp.]|jgi:2-dehydropantoate 2-reductase|nr:2-dehydropantoate 2-reductase [Candidatus Sulfotelmatobacter sp.]